MPAAKDYAAADVPTPSSERRPGLGGFDDVLLGAAGVMTESPSPTLPPAPFAPGSVSIRLYPHNELPAGAIVGELCAQACLALRQRLRRRHDQRAPRRLRRVHGAAPADGLLPSSGERATGWAAAAPLLLPLRSTALVAEEVAWLPRPGLSGAGVVVGAAAGALPLDFAAAGVDQADAVGRFKAELPRLVAMLRGEDLGELDGDPALRACRRGTGARAQRGRVGGRRAAGGGLAGILDGRHVGAGATRPVLTWASTSRGTGSRS